MHSVIQRNYTWSEIIRNITYLNQHSKAHLIQIMIWLYNVSICLQWYSLLLNFTLTKIGLIFLAKIDAKLYNM